jgi:hypothetical protein
MMKKLPMHVLCPSNINVGIALICIEGLRLLQLYST